MALLFLGDHQHCVLPADRLHPHQRGGAKQLPCPVDESAGRTWICSSHLLGRRALWSHRPAKPDPVRRQAGGGTGDFAGLCRTDQERTIAFLPLAAGSHGGAHTLLCTVAQRHDGKGRCVPADPPGAGDVRHLCRLYGEPGGGLYIPDHFHAGHYRQ